MRSNHDPAAGDKRAIPPLEESLLKLATLATAAIGLAISIPSNAADTFYLGAWKFDSAIVAPWAGPNDKPDVAEKNALLGKTITIAPREISGPKVFACKGPHYKLTDYTADLLFQGEFGEMHESNKAKDPQQLAASLGFNATPIKTLETGCEFDWHFVDHSTAEIGLNNYVYVLKKQ
jgi:hypothetical protein